MPRFSLKSQHFKANQERWGIDLFSGAGGMSLGAESAGITVKFAVDIDPHASATHRHNFPKTTFLQQDIRTIDKAAFGLKRPYVVFGGAPCQGFSTSNQRTRTSTNANNWLYQEFIKVVRFTRPSWVIFENVKGFIETEGGSFLSSLVKSLEQLNYKVDYATLNSRYFGIPQDRTRLFVIGRLGSSFTFPSLQGTGREVRLKEVFEDLPALENGASEDVLPYKRRPASSYAKALRGNLKECGNHYVTKSANHIVKRYESVPPGGNWEDIPETLMQNYADRTRCHTGIYHRLRLDKPSVVIGNYRKNMLIHPAENRGLSVREAARIQSFPDSFYFTGSIGFQQQQVANAVPPQLAREVFSLILKADGVL